ncbi:MAG: peptidoglycan-binding protein [Flammeovirgaceae bacterium]|nr:peptidoglycan-binding protein [Flammeovirgaceae bacterium]
MADMRFQFSDKPLSFQEQVEKVLNNEGGFSDHKDDKGGMTNFGISQRSYPLVDIRNLTREQAIEIYYRDYWVKYKVEMLPHHLQGAFFDMAVNHGGRRAVKILQESANNRNKKQIAVDGFIGKQTAKAVERLEVDRLIAFRCLFFAKIVLNNETQMKFWVGWFRRCVEGI